jgi:hypothetical protein
VERACQAKAQEVCMNLTNEYETKVRSVSIEKGKGQSLYQAN